MTKPSVAQVIWNMKPLLIFLSVFFVAIAAYNRKVIAKYVAIRDKYPEGVVQHRLASDLLRSSYGAQTCYFVALALLLGTMFAAWFWK